MSAIETRDLWARVMLALAEGECDLKTSKHQERPKQLSMVDGIQAHYFYDSFKE